MSKDTDAATTIRPKVVILGDEKKCGTHSRFRVDIDKTSIYLTYCELIIFATLAISRAKNIHDGWVRIDELGVASANTRSHLWRLLKRFHEFKRLERWSVYESDRCGNIRLMTDPERITLDLDMLAGLGDYRVEKLLG